MSYGLANFLEAVIPILFICYLVAWALSMSIVTGAAREKGYTDLNGKLWFIGFFGLMFTPPIIVAALPDKRLQDAQVDGEPDPRDELPSL